MKFVFDFDGVLTDQTEEAHRVRELLAQEFARETALPLAQVEEALRAGEAALKATPWKYGWRINGRLSAFSDEDLFVRASALALWVELTDNSLRRTLLERGAASPVDIAERAYQGMLEETRRGEMKPLEDASKGILETLVAKGHEIVIVSNSGTDRILNILDRAGIEPGPRLRVRGGAMKFALGDRSETFMVGHYPVEIDRPHFKKILFEELPHVAIGDVFSLDLALPAHLAKTDDRLRGLRLFLRTRPYTPAWSRDWCLGAGNSQPDRVTFEAIETLDPLLALS